MERERRLPLLRSMHERADSSIDCRGCTAVCCTASHNTMQIDLLEALDIFLALHAHGLHTNVTAEAWFEPWRARLGACVQRYRLGVDLPLPRGKRWRRSYTCPFHTPYHERELHDAAFGCVLPLESKPLGCLAFNPDIAGQTDGGSCRSDQSALEQRAERFAKAEAYQCHQLRDLLCLDDNDEPKAAIPLMLLHFADATERSGITVQALIRVRNAH